MATKGWRLGNRIAPPRFLTFLAVIIIGTPIGVSTLGWAPGAMAAFDAAALIFFILIASIFNDQPEGMRRSAKENDANRAGLLVITAIVSLVVLASVTAVLTQQ